MLKEKWVRATHHTYRIGIEVPEGFKVCPYPECHQGHVAGDPQDGDVYTCHICRGKGYIAEKLELCFKCSGHLSVTHYGSCPECGRQGGYTKSCDCKNGLRTAHKGK
jgi:hypothetical protein